MNWSPFNLTSFAIDLGNNNTLLTDRERIRFSQPSCVVFESATNRVKAVGEEAYKMLEKSHLELKAVKPMKRGVIADYDSALAMIDRMVSKTFTRRRFWQGFDTIISGVPYSTTEVERRALRDTLDQLNPRKRHLLAEPLAAALGMGLNIREPEGKMVVDIGGGITEIVIISLSGIAVFRSIKTAGDTFTENIQDHLRKYENFIVGWKSAEMIKTQVGSVLENLADGPEPLMVRGKDAIEGLPVQRLITHEDVARMVNGSYEHIEDQIRHALEVCPPELSSDIYQNGIYLTGGGSLMRGMKERLAAATQLPVHLDDEPLLSVTKGIATVLREPGKFRGVLMD